MELSIRDLVSVTGGRLVMSSLPPLGGSLEPIESVSFDSRKCGKGSLFWSLTGTTSCMPSWASCSDETFADHAFSNGALGVVVTSRPIEPWAGGFALHVKENAEALGRFAQWNRSRFLGPVVVVIDAGGGLESYCRGVASASGHTGAVDPADSLVELQASFAQLDDESPFTIISLRADSSFSADSAISRISHLCSPDIAVITPLAFETTLHNAFQTSRRNSSNRHSSMLANLVAHARAVVLPGNKLTPELRSVLQGEVVTYGLEPDNQIQAERILRSGNELRFAVSNTEFQMADCSDTMLSQGLATIALCDYLKIKKQHVKTALANPQVTSMAS